MTTFDTVILVLAICGVVLSSIYWINKKIKQKKGR